MRGGLFFDGCRAAVGDEVDAVRIPRMWLVQAQAILQTLGPSIEKSERKGQGDSILDANEKEEVYLCYGGFYAKADARPPAARFSWSRGGER